MKASNILTAFIGLFTLGSFVVSATDYYEMLNVARDADDRTIRKAFKKIAILKHPDKNPDNPEAHDEFVRINRAYEVLKDEELRKKYDKYGEEGLKDDFHGGREYQSWQFYNDNFGIYDDDAEIVTLSRANFQQSVLDSGDLWFVNFYSTFCSHCHDLAPTWREFARDMEGVIRIGAVNCAEDPNLCQMQQVMAYPSLVLYPEGIQFQGPRNLKALTDFVMARLVAEVHRVTFKNYVALSTEWDQYAPRPWVLDFCDGDESGCLSKQNRRKLASILKDIANVGVVSCPEHQRDLLCKKLRDNGVAFYPAGQLKAEQEHEIDSLDPKEIYAAVLDLMPEWPQLEDEEYEQLIENHETTFVRFYDGEKNDEDNSQKELKKLPMTFPQIKTKQVDCGSQSDICSELKLNKDDLPRFVLFKPNGGYEINYAKKQSIHDLISFVRESLASQLITLTPDAYNEAINSDELYLIDYFAPWCPPCMKLIPSLRKLPKSIGDIPLHVGTLDCVAHKALCQQANIASYPTKIIYYKGKTYNSVGSNTAEEIVEFIEDSLNPTVEILDPSTFEEHVTNRVSGTTWIVDFFAPWCGPCQQLAPEFRKLSRLIKADHENVRFGSVDCDAHRSLCQAQRVSAYPNIRLYRSQLHRQTMEYPSNWWRDHGSMKRWVEGFLPSLVTEISQDFYSEVLSSSDPWLVDFFAPWCGHCIQFAPVFEKLAKSLEGHVKLAKVDCDRSPGICQAAGIRAYPSLRFYPGAKGTQQNAGGVVVQSQNPDNIIQTINRVLAQHRRDEL